MRLEGSLTISAVEHIEQIVDLLPEACWSFAARPWPLTWFSRQRLLTCDTRGLLVPHSNQPRWSGVDLLATWALAPPLSADTAVLKTDPAPVAEHVTREYVASGVLDRVEPANTRWARALQRWPSTTLIASCITTHDSSLVPEDLPERVSMEIVAPTKDFVAMGEQNAGGQARPSHS